MVHFSLKFLDMVQVSVCMKKIQTILYYIYIYMCILDFYIYVRCFFNNMLNLSYNFKIFKIFYLS